MEISHGKTRLSSAGHTNTRLRLLAELTYNWIRGVKPVWLELTVEFYQQE
jgi:hypothetical protein